MISDPGYSGKYFENGHIRDSKIKNKVSPWIKTSCLIESLTARPLVLSLFMQVANSRKSSPK
jgi:hypothetical protein